MEETENEKLPQQQILFPGDEINPKDYILNSRLNDNNDEVDDSFEVILGPGLIQKGEVLLATSCGILKYREKGNYFWIESNSKRYVPKLGDSVIGVITKRLGEAYYLDIGSAHRCNLSAYAFEGASKKTKPNLKVGNLLFGKVVVAHKDMEPEIECYNSSTNKSEGYGELVGGFVFNCSIGMCKRLYDPNYPLLSLLESKVAFEIAIGFNGTIWILSENEDNTIKIRNAILNAESINSSSLEDLSQMVEDTFDSI